MELLAHAQTDIQALIAAVRELEDKYNLALDDLNEIGSKVRELQKEIERLKAALGMVFYVQFRAWHHVNMNDSSTSGCYAEYIKTRVGPYPTRLEAVLALADKLGL